MDRQAMLEIIEEQIRLIRENSSRCAAVGNYSGLVLLTDELIKLLDLIGLNT